jgi:hypothetical protein
MQDEDGASRIEDCPPTTNGGRKETVLSVQRIAARVHLGSDHTAKANLHAWMKRGKKGQVN